MKAWFLVAIVVLSTVFSDVLQSVEMKRQGEITEFHPHGIRRQLAALFRRWRVILAFVWMAVSFFAFAELLAVADISFAVPATAASLAVETALARVLLRESVGARRWVGAMLVACGVVLLA